MNKKIRDLVIVGGTFLLGVLTSGWYFYSNIETDTQTVVVKPSASSKEVKTELAANTNNYNQLVKSNNQLKQQVAELTKQLTDSNQHSEIVRRGETEPNNEIPEKKKFDFMAMMTPDFLKSAAVMQLRPATSELTHRLELSQEQSQSLADLLKQKVEADIDANAVMMEKMAKANARRLNEDSLNGNMDESDYQQDMFAQGKDLLAQSQRNYQQQLTDILSAEQLEQYQDFEQEKQQQQYQMNMTMRSITTMSKIPSLDEYQKSEITRFFEQRPISLPEVKVGTFGSSFAQRPFSGDPEFNTSLQQQLVQLLSYEQLEAYRKSRQQNLKNITSMMGGNN